MLLQTLHGHTDVIYTVSFAPNGKELASGGADKCIIIWNLSTGNMCTCKHVKTDLGNPWYSNPRCVGQKVGTIPLG